ncbi:hypothetical protein [Methylomagnum sp.]
MNTHPFLNTCLSKLDELLDRQFQTSAPDFTSKVNAIAAQLPEEPAQALYELLGRQAALNAETVPAPESLADFAFLCGRAYEQLEAWRRIQMEMENVLTGPDSVSATPLQASQVEPLARFVEVRDRLFRKVADVTLKALLIGLGLLILGLVFGLI